MAKEGGDWNLWGCGGERSNHLSSITDHNNYVFLFLRRLQCRLLNLAKATPSVRGWGFELSHDRLGYNQPITERL